MSKFLADELSRFIARKQAIFVAGAGITISATGDPVNCSWQGLLRLGLQRCQEVQAAVDPGWVATVLAKITSSDPASLIEGAQEIQLCLQSKPGSHFRKWLATTVGSLRAKNPGILRAIADLGIPVATTNYDSLLANELGGEHVTWRSPEGIQRIVRGEESGVIHIHGHWQDPSSVVLGVASYAAAMGDRRSQEIVRSLFASHSVIFAGFGAGLDDPNFTGLRTWAREILVESDYPPSILVRSPEVAAAEKQYGPDGFQVISFGDENADLELFLAGLKPTTSPKPTESSYDWASLQIKLARLNRRIRRDWDPELVVSMSGPGNFAPSYCMSLDTTETPVINAVTFPKVSGRSTRNTWFGGVAASAAWKHFESTKWDVFLPNMLTHLPIPTRILIFDDRVIRGHVQSRVAQWLTELGHEVRRAAIVVHPDAVTSVSWYEDVQDGEFSFPWGGRRGRA
jgi:hypothetical protein